MIVGDMVHRDQGGRLEAQIGARLRARRVELGVTEAALAEALELTGDIVRQWETGQRRLSALQLANVAGFLGVPVSYFFIERPANSLREGLERAQFAYGPEPAAQRAGVDGARIFNELLAALDSATDDAQRRWIANLLVRAGAPLDLVDRARQHSLERSGS